MSRLLRFEIPLSLMISESNPDQMDESVLSDLDTDGDSNSVLMKSATMHYMVARVGYQVDMKLGESAKKIVTRPKELVFG
jgi:hypothetical protein